MKKQAGSIGGWIGLAILILGGAAIAFAVLRPVPDLVVYKTESCSCCAKWVEHMESSGLETRVVEVENMNAIKQDLGLPSGMASCHTAIAGDRYLIEGHVPAAEIIELLKNRPDDIQGIAVPGMPVGSPGMEGAEPVHYKVYEFNESGDIRVRAEYFGTQKLPPGN